MSKDKKVVDIKKDKKVIGKKFTVLELETAMNALAEIPYKYSAQLIQFLAQNGEPVFEEDKKDAKED